MKSLRTLKQTQNSGQAAGQSRGRRRRGGSGRGFALTLGIVCALVLAGGVGWVLWTHRTTRGSTEFFGDAPAGTARARGDQHKPSAGKPAVAPRGTEAKAASQAAAVATPPGVPPAAAVPAPAASSAVPVPGARLNLHAERKGMRNGCKDGMLSLHPDSLGFECPGDRGKSVTVTVSEVKGPDDDGIETLRHEKYHFKVEGMSKEDTRVLFAEWLRASQTAGGAAR